MDPSQKAQRRSAPRRSWIEGAGIALAIVAGVLAPSEYLVPVVAFVIAGVLAIGTVMGGGRAKLVFALIFAATGVAALVAMPHPRPADLARERALDAQLARMQQGQPAVDARVRRQVAAAERQLDIPVDNRAAPPN